MTKDNNILGQFLQHNIPPGPAGSLKFLNEFSIDADGILTVTTTDVQTGKEHSLTLDSKTSGRMSTDEVNEVIARAARMREADERETKRVLARTDLETFCRELMLAFSWNPTNTKSTASRAFLVSKNGAEPLLSPRQALRQALACWACSAWAWGST